MDGAARTLVGTAAVILAADVWLVRSGRRTVSQALRDNPWAATAATALVMLHLADRLGRADPFHLVGRRIPPRQTVKGCSTLA